MDMGPARLRFQLLLQSVYSRFVILVIELVQIFR